MADLADGLTAEQIEEHAAIHHVFGPVFLKHLLSETASDRKNILKLLIEWTSDEAAELPGGLVVLRTSDVPFGKLEVLRTGFAVCVHTFRAEEAVLAQGCALLKSLLANTKLTAGLKQSDITPELKPVVRAIGAQLGSHSMAVRTKMIQALLAICRRAPSAPHVSVTVGTLGAYPIPAEASLATATLYALMVLVHTYGLKEDPNTKGLVPVDRVLAYLSACLQKEHKELSQVCYRAMADLVRVLGEATATARLETPYRHDVGRFLQHSSQSTTAEDATRWFSLKALAQSPTSPQMPSSHIGSGIGSEMDQQPAKGKDDDDDDDALEFNPNCRITKDVLSGASKLTRHREESTKRYLERVSHLALEHKGIDAIDNLQNCPNLRVLYLYENRLQRIENLDWAIRLTHLYLNNNYIESLDGLQRLRSLQKLYINYNRLSRLDCIGGLSFLQELHMSHQEPPVGHKMVLDGETLYGLAQLQTLTLASNHIVDVEPLRQLASIQTLDISGNEVGGPEPVVMLVQQLKGLRSLQVAKNPFAVGKYLDELILHSSPALGKIDNRDVTAAEREFLRQLKTRKRGSASRPSSGPPATGAPSIGVMAKEVHMSLGRGQRASSVGPRR
mmetsp:Transcript_53924/g.96034  ORF Transcript_53924/g.96034 Transcript_53924/m.96034 type:complete len:617 (-) Transcript_53924:59-1909(-)